MHKNTTNNNINFEQLPCFRCGICCRRYQVRLTLAEARRLAGNLQIGWTEFVNTYTDPRWPGQDTFLLRHRHGSCIFLKNTAGGLEKRCLIYPFRPQDCHEWTPALTRSECQQGLTRWNLKVNAHGKLKGSKVDLQKFQSFLNTLK